MKSFKFIKILAVALVALATLGCGDSNNDWDFYSDVESIVFQPSSASVEIGSANVPLAFKATLSDGSTYTGSLGELVAEGYDPAFYGYTLQAVDGTPATHSTLNAASGAIVVGDTAGVFSVNLVNASGLTVSTFTLTVTAPEKTITAAFFHGATAANPEVGYTELAIGVPETLTFDVTYSDGTTATVQFPELKAAGYTLFLHWDDNTLDLNYNTGVVSLLPDNDSYDIVELYAPGVTPQAHPDHPEAVSISAHTPKPVSTITLGEAAG